MRFNPEQKLDIGDCGEKVKEIISEHAGVPACQIDDNMSLQTDLGIDSFSLICMLEAIEDTFHISINESDVAKFQTLQDVHNFIRAKQSNLI